ncbi:hypothetical protein PIB30_098865, partial [Stylosanthes scabra]|nr:hypothetical protein [Stylosanthes scabra]
MTVDEYARKFENLCRFSRVCQGAPEQFVEWKCARFEDGLREEILNTVGPMEIRNFAELVNKCRLAEQCSRKWESARNARKEQPRRDFNRNLAPQNRPFKNFGQAPRPNLTSNNSPAQFSGNKNNNGNQRQDNGKRLYQAQGHPVCPKCGKFHGN